MKIKNKKQNQGLTLIELIVSVAILIIITSMSVMGLSSETSKTRDARRLSDLKIISDSITTSHTKGSPVKYDVNYTTTGSNNYIVTNIFQEDSGGDAKQHSSIRVLRNAYAVTITDDFIDGTIVAKISRDPKGMPYLAAFINNNTYQLFATLENSETKVQRAFIQGTLKSGSVLDTLTEDLAHDSSQLIVGSSDQFIVGDIITIDSEEMVVHGIDISQSIVYVNRLSSFPKPHNEGAVIKLKEFAPGADSLLCYGSLAKIMPRDDKYQEVPSPPPIKDARGNMIGMPGGIDSTYVCAGNIVPIFKDPKYPEGSIVHGGKIVPYTVLNQ